MTDPFQQIRLEQIRIDGGTQPRAEIREDVVAEYAQAMQDGDEFPPILVVFDGVDYWLADGFHRYHARRKVGETILAKVKSGTRQDARDLANSGVFNGTHGLRETSADKARRVANVLADHPDWSDGAAADHCRVSRNFVATTRASCAPKQDAPRKVTVTRKGQTYEMEIKPKAKPAPQPEEQIDITMDANGDPIADPKIAEVFDAIGRIEAAQNQIQAVRKTVAELGKGSSLAAYLPLQKFDADLKNAWQALKFATPHMQCPLCKAAGCKACRQTGWMPKEVFDALPAR